MIADFAVQPAFSNIIRSFLPKYEVKSRQRRRTFSPVDNNNNNRGLVVADKTEWILLLLLLILHSVSIAYPLDTQ